MRNADERAVEPTAEAVGRDRRASGTHVRVRSQEPAAAEDAAGTPPQPVSLRVVHAGELPSPSNTTSDAAPRQETAEFAAQVLRVARAIADGTDRALIEQVWRAGFADVPLEDFKQLLFTNHKRGLIVLGRADLRAHRYPRADLDASEIARSSLRFHFVRTVVPGRPAPR